MLSGPCPTQESSKAVRGSMYLHFVSGLATYGLRMDGPLPNFTQHDYLHYADPYITDVVAPELWKQCRANLASLKVAFFAQLKSGSGQLASRESLGVSRYVPNWWSALARSVNGSDLREEFLAGPVAVKGTFAARVGQPPLPFLDSVLSSSAPPRLSPSRKGVARLMGSWMPPAPMLALPSLAFF